MIKTRFYEGIVKLMPDMTMEAYLRAIGLDKFLKENENGVYKELLLINVREHVNRGYFFNRPELRAQLTAIYNERGLDRAVTVFYRWLEEGLLYIDKNSKGLDLEEFQVIRHVRYNCDPNYRIVRMFNRKLRTKLRELRKLDVKMDDGRTLGQAIHAIDENLDRIEKPMKRETLEVIDTAVVGVKDIIKEEEKPIQLPPIEKEYPSGDWALWYNGYEIRIVSRTYNTEACLNRDRWSRLHVSDKVIKAFEEECKQAGEQYQHYGSNSVKGHITLFKSRNRVIKWKRYMIDTANARYNQNTSYDAYALSDADILKAFYRRAS